MLPYIRHAQMAQSAAADTREPAAALAASAEPAATQKCQFGGIDRASRLPFRRKYGTNCNICSISSPIKNAALSNDVFDFQTSYK
ncbi:MAG: hypothetical protein H0X30_15645 [Anaerolineae bacterium]|nr:hypothetical protein [Anaerolineae bacterium]